MVQPRRSWRERLRDWIVDVAYRSRVPLDVRLRQPIRRRERLALWIVNQILR